MARELQSVASMIIYDCEAVPAGPEEYVEGLAGGRESSGMACGESYRTMVRVGTRRPGRAGPAGRRWMRVSLPRGRDRDDAIEYYQALEREIVLHAIVRVGNADFVDLHIHNASHEQLELFNNTFCTYRLVPMDHLRRVNDIRPRGIYVANTAGAPGDSLSYMGGTNMADRIVITRGSLWNRGNRDISTTVLHEIGHVMTHPGDRTMYLDVRPADRQRIRAGRSRNAGTLEGLCDAYMYLLCFLSENESIHNFGRLGGDAQTRRILRNCSAFTALDGDDLFRSWSDRLREDRARSRA